MEKLKRGYKDIFTETSWIIATLWRKFSMCDRCPYPLLPYFLKPVTKNATFPWIYTKLYKNIFNRESRLGQWFLFAAFCAINARVMIENAKKSDKIDKLEKNVKRAACTEAETNSNPQHSQCISPTWRISLNTWLVQQFAKGGGGGVTLIKKQVWHHFSSLCFFFATFISSAVFLHLHKSEITGQKRDKKILKIT